MKEPLVFALGDVVKYSPTCKKWFIKQGAETIICDTSFAGGSDVKYGTCEGAWFNRDELIFVKRATRRTVRKACKSNNEE